MSGATALPGKTCCARRLRFSSVDPARLRATTTNALGSIFSRSFGAGGTVYKGAHQGERRRDEVVSSCLLIGCADVLPSLSTYSSFCSGRAVLKLAEHTPPRNSRSPTAHHPPTAMQEHQRAPAWCLTFAHHHRCSATRDTLAFPSSPTLMTR